MDSFSKNSNESRAHTKISTPSCFFEGTATKKKVDEEASDEDDDCSSSGRNLRPLCLPVVSRNAHLLFKGA